MAVLSYAAATLFTYTIAVYVYRIYFSPLSHIPGPRLAAATSLYEFYYDAVKEGRYWARIAEMHQKYGPIVRISPYEIHISDPHFFSTLYSQNSYKLEKYQWFYSFISRNGSIFATADSSLHKLRSVPIKKAFSTSAISRIEPVLVSHFQAFSNVLQNGKQEQKTVPLGTVFRSLAADIVTDLAMPESYNLLDTKDLGFAHADFVLGITKLATWNRFIPYLIPLLDKIPRWLVKLQGETALHVVDGVLGQMMQARRLVENKGKPISNKEFPVIMNEVYNCEVLPPKEKTVKRLFDEVGIIIGAGSETTGMSLSATIWHVLANPEIHERLRKEIRDEFTEEELNTILSYKRLEGLPYLNACVMEGLRLANAVSGRLPRINRTQAMAYHGTIDGSKEVTYAIPPNTPVSMSIRDVHYNPTVFPSPTTFDPERWLDPVRKQVSEKFFVAFGRGTRSCIGRNLAMAEMLMGVANLIGRFQCELGEGMGRDEIELVHDCFSAYVGRGKGSMRIRVR